MDGSSLRSLVWMAQVAMNVQVDTSALRKTEWYEYVVRFVFGGLITAIAGIIASHFGPVVGGLFLAFPAIFPASATLIEKHAKEKQRPKQAPERGRQAVSQDAEGSAIGSLGLIAFAIFVWQFVTVYRAWLVIAGATAIWLSVAFLLWRLKQKMRPCSENADHNEGADKQES